MRYKIHPFIQWWFAPEFPEVHIRKFLLYKPEGILNYYKDKFRTWVVHPVKRRVAKYYLLILKKLFNLKVFAITGSAGKTSTKDMIASILSQEGQTQSSYKNIDPIFNIPMTIFKCTPFTKYLVLEMGVEYPGEMDFYLWLAKPDIGVITNIYPTHTLYFNNIHGVFAEKIKLLKILNKDDYAIINKSDSYLRKHIKDMKCKLIWFGDKTEVSAKNVKNINPGQTVFNLHVGDEVTEIYLHSSGDQFVENSLAATAVANCIGISSKKIVRGLKLYKNPEHRMSIIRHKSGAIIIDDSYNNNPQAAKKAINTLVKLAGSRKKAVVFGDMLELGKDEVKFHNDIGRYLNHLKIDMLIGVGHASRWTVKQFNKGQGKGYWVKEISGVNKYLNNVLNNKFYILIKGSRSIRLDKLISTL